MTMSTKIDSTIHLLTEKLTEAAVKHGAEIIGKWEADLENAEWRGAKTIHTDLTKLRHHLEGDTRDGVAIGELLIKLGESTDLAATHSEGDGGKIESLGQALISAGKGLGADAK
jgi:hypothetical protein